MSFPLTLAASADPGSTVKAARNASGHNRNRRQRAPVECFLVGPPEPRSCTAIDMAIADASREARTTEEPRFAAHTGKRATHNLGPRIAPARQHGHQKHDEGIAALFRGGATWQMLVPRQRADGRGCRGTLRVRTRGPQRRTGRRKLRRPVRGPPPQKLLIQSEARTPSLARWKAPRSFRLPGEFRRAQLFTTCLPSGFNALYGIRCLRTSAFCRGNQLAWYFG